MAGYRDGPPRFPRDFSVADILRAPAHEPKPLTPEAAERAEGEARTALWEMDFALQELEWLSRGVTREAPLVESIASQLAYSAGCLERYPVDLGPLPEDLAAALAERFGRLTEALEDLDPHWAGHERLTAAYGRLRTSLELRGVVD